MLNLFTLLAAMDVKDVPDSNVRPADAPFWFPYQASPFAADVDFLYLAIYWICVVFFVLIVGAMCYLVVKYRRQPGVGPQPSPSHNTVLELAWSILPSILLAWMFWEGARGYYASQTIPEGAEEIYVTAMKWNWKFTYPDGDSSDELHLVNGRPVRLIMESSDVLHSMYVAAFRQKKDIVPGRYTDCYFLPNRIGKYRLACTEYCGDEHSRMRTLCQVHKDDAERKASTKWETDKHTPEENGARLFNMNCSGCHDVAGAVKTGPALNLVYSLGNRPLHGGGSAKVDENYLRESILYPEAKVAEGFGPVTQMQSFQGKLSDTDIRNLIAYIKQVNGVSSAPAEEAGAPETPAGTDPAAPATGDAPAGTAAPGGAAAPAGDATAPAGDSGGAAAGGPPLDGG